MLFYWYVTYTQFTICTKIYITKFVPVLKSYSNSVPFQKNCTACLGYSRTVVQINVGKYFYLEVQ